MSIKDYWFSPDWTTDDAYQQLFPFLELSNPGRFRDDIVYRMMRGYLTPLHYLLGAFFTYLTFSPVMVGHLMMLIQLVLTLFFFGGAVYRFAGIVPALFSIVWFLHTREVVQRLTSGLPRGWSAPLIGAFLFFVLRNANGSVLITLALGCVLHPPTTMIIALTYGLVLCIRVCNSETRQATWPHLKRLVIFSPLYVIATLLAIKMPAEFGAMASLDEARTMPEFDSSGGRFPFVPLVPYFEEWWRFGFQAFYNKWERPSGLMAWVMPLGIVASTVSLIVYNFRSKIRILPLEVLIFGVCSIFVHYLSRVFAFRLYVPNRHLQIPMACFFIFVFSVGLWRLFCYSHKQGSCVRYFRGLLGLFIIVMVVVYGSGSGLQGKANFNTHKYQKGRFAHWIREQTPGDAIIAGYPTLVDAVPLFGERRVYISTEMAHPFYRGYYESIRQRIELSLKAHYAGTLDQLYDLVAPVGIDYFVFQRSLFYPEALEGASYFKPYDQLVFSLTRGDQQRYAYRELPREVDMEKVPFMPFKDNVAAVVDIHQLGKFLGRE
jgi:hypothetical protein